MGSGNLELGKVLQNRTARRIEVKGHCTAPLIIPPFGERVLEPDDEGSYDLASWTKQRLVSVETIGQEEHDGSLAASSPIVAGYSFMSAVVLLVLWRWATGSSTFAWGALMAGLVTLIFGWPASRQGWGEVFRRIGHSFTVFTIVVVGAVVPAVIVISLSAYYEGTLEDASVGYFGSTAMVLLIILLTVASILPAALYFWFHRQRLPTMRENLLRDIVRLDPNVQTVDDADRSYGKRIDDAYGRSAKRSSNTRTGIAGHGRLPIVIATVMITGLWIWTLLAEVEQRGDMLIATEAFETPNRFAIFWPETGDVVGFAFLGTYFFALNMLFRRYAPSDLNPKAYTHICVRILTAIVLAWVVSQLPHMTKLDGRPNGAMLALAFFIGIMPETGTAIIQDFLQRTFGKVIPSLKEEHPLSKLHGVSLYDRSQLLEVGIENVESLAHHNLVDLMLWTRIPTSRLVDFVDQAVLYLHVNGGHHDQTGDDEARELLAEYGIRTATDLERTYQSADDETAFLNLLGGVEGVPRLRVILDALEDDEWMMYVRNWRDQSMFSKPISSADEFVEHAKRGPRLGPVRPGSGTETTTDTQELLPVASTALARHDGDALETQPA